MYWEYKMKWNRKCPFKDHKAAWVVEESHLVLIMKVSAGSVCVPVHRKWPSETCHVEWAAHGWHPLMLERPRAAESLLP